MENLIARVAAVAGTTPETARQAVALMLDFLRREGPEDAIETLMNSAPAFRTIVASSSSIGGEGMSPLVKSLMGTGAGSMGGGGLAELGANLMRLGLGMDQIHALGKTIFEYARQAAGDDVMGEISAAIPGLSQFV
ncbi:MAG: DUF2267 domain-containing protein [Roseiarcus sp.]